MLVCPGPWLQSPVGVYVQTQIFTNVVVHCPFRCLKGNQEPGRHIGFEIFTTLPLIEVNDEQRGSLTVKYMGRVRS